MNPDYSSPNTASQSSKAIPDNEVVRGNEQLDFALQGYLNPDAKPGVSPTPETAARAIAAMYCYAKRVAWSCGARAGEWAEEALSEAFIDIARSNLTRIYEQRSAGIKPYLNRIIQRKVSKLMSDVAKERRRYETAPLPIETAVSDINPLQLVELEDLASRCEELLESNAAEPQTANLVERSSSTQGVQRHRERKEQWRRIAHLFPAVSFRPRRRRCNTSSRSAKNFDSASPLKFSDAKEQ